MAYYPIFLELQGMEILVVGGGSVAQRKIETLIEYGGKITIISRELTPKLKEMVDHKDIFWKGTEFREKDLEGISLVIAATDDKELNHLISKSARKLGLLVNAVDQPSDCSFIVPSIVKRGDLIIAISTSGKSPAYARKVRMKLEKDFGHEYEKFLMIMGRIRQEILALGFTQDENRSFFQRVADSDIIDAIKNEDWERVEYRLKELIPKGLSVDRLLNGIGY